MNALFWLVVVGHLSVASRAWAMIHPQLIRRSASATTTTSLRSFPDLDLGKLFGITIQSKETDKIERERLKAQLLDLCQQKSNVERARLEEIIKALAPMSPTPNSASSPLLQKEWILTWTTEKEINFFIDFGIASQVSQIIRGTALGNEIAFARGGGLFVAGTLRVEEPDSMRTYFKFDTATLDLGKWGTYSFPPVGEGWFDTVYLDDKLRIDLNSRNDILICQAKP